MTFSLTDFVIESNRIEGIDGASTDQVETHEWFLARTSIAVDDLELFVDAVQPGAKLRTEADMNVRVGSHIAPRGGPAIISDLEDLLDDLHAGRANPFATHVAYETLHPFMDGNGRSGRALWLWMMDGIERAPLGFLHHFYYQTLAARR